jgi:hypothetical protein
MEISEHTSRNISRNILIPQQRTSIRRRGRNPAANLDSPSRKEPSSEPRFAVEEGAQQLPPARPSYASCDTGLGHREGGCDRRRGEEQGQGQEAWRDAPSGDALRAHGEHRGGAARCAVYREERRREDGRLTGCKDVVMPLTDTSRYKQTKHNEMKPGFAYTPAKQTILARYTQA